MRRVLFVTFDYPPINSPGAERASKFAKHLPSFGWEPIILTSTSPRDESATASNSETGQRVVRILNKHPLRRYSCVRRGPHASQQRNEFLSTETRNASPLTLAPVKDLMEHASKRLGINVALAEPWNWRRPAIDAGISLVREMGIDCVFTSIKPVTAAFVGSEIQRQTGIPWIAEYRDPWSLSPYMHAQRLKPIRLAESFLEKTVMKRSTAIVSVSQYWSTRIGDFLEKPSACVYHGFDRDDYYEEEQPSGHFSIVHTGTLYSGKRDPSPVFEAIARLNREGTILSGDLTVEFVGANTVDELQHLAQAFDVASFVQFHPKVSFQESLRCQQRAAVLLLLSWNDPRDAGTLTSKLFAYMGAGRPILAIGYQEGELASIIRQAGCGTLVNSATQARDLLATWLSEFRQKGSIRTSYHPRAEIIDSYSRYEQARRLAILLDTVTTDHQSKWEADTDYA